MTHAVRINSDEPTASGVSCDRIVCEDEAAEVLHRTVQRPATFHRLDSVGDYEVNRDPGGQFFHVCWVVGEILGQALHGSGEIVTRHCPAWLLAQRIFQTLPNQPRFGHTDHLGLTLELGQDVLKPPRDILRKRLSTGRRFPQPWHKPRRPPQSAASGCRRRALLAPAPPNAARPVPRSVRLAPAGVVEPAPAPEPGRGGKWGPYGLHRPESG